MSERIMLPGSIPGLLRRGSPVIDHTGERLVVLTLCNDGPWCAHMISVGDYERAQEVDLAWSDAALDLSDPTGRAHAAWWLDGSIGALFSDDADLMTDAAWGDEDTTDDEIRRLRDLVLEEHARRSMPAAAPSMPPILLGWLSMHPDLVPLLVPLLVVLALFAALAAIGIATDTTALRRMGAAIRRTR